MIKLAVVFTEITSFKSIFFQCLSRIHFLFLPYFLFPFLIFKSRLLILTFRHIQAPQGVGSEFLVDDRQKDPFEKYARLYLLSTIILEIYM